MRLAPSDLHLREDESAIVPLPALELPPELELGGDAWLRKDEFHLTAAHVPTLTQFAVGAGGEEAEALERVKAALRRATWEFEIGPIELGDELRLVREDDERSIVVMASVPGVERLHRHLGAELGLELEPPPAHVTIYTGPEARGGIGLHTAEHIARLTEPLGGPEADRLRAALLAAFPG